MGWTRQRAKNPVNLTLRSTVNIVSGSWMCSTHCFMVIHTCAKYGKPMSNENKLLAGHENMSKPSKFAMRSKVNVVSGSWMCATHCLVVILSFLTFSKPMSRSKKSYGPDTDGQTDRDTDRQSDEQTEWFLYTHTRTSFTGGLIKMFEVFWTTR